VQWKGCFITEETGYDQGYASHSPGRVLYYRVIQDLVERNSPRLMSMGFGDAEYKEIWANKQSLSGPVMLVRRSMRPMLAMRFEQCRRKIPAACGPGSRTPAS
jgi:CelD/BcsL family acetyltransferase involved in cellulose biosynthesis